MASYRVFRSSQQLYSEGWEGGGEEGGDLAEGLGVVVVVVLGVGGIRGLRMRTVCIEGQL